VLVAECRADRLQVALSGASRELCELLLSSMSERAANMLRGELDSLPPQRRRSIEEAQAEIITIAKRLAEEGRIFILGDEDEAPYD
jgi:flagellar motor switch protein FliG